MKKIVFLALSLFLTNFTFAQTTYEKQKEDNVQFVKEAVKHFKKHEAQDSFALFSYKLGSFVKEDSYIFVYDYDGDCIAIGKYQERIGDNFIDAKDENDKYFIKALIEKAKSGGGWVEYIWKKAKKMSYVKEIEDKKAGKKYVIGSGFYPIIEEKENQLIYSSNPDFEKIQKLNEISNSKDKIATKEELDLSNASLYHKDLKGLNLNKADFSYADLSESDLSNASLIDANFEEANLYKATLVNADFTGAKKLQTVSVRLADFKNAKGLSKEDVKYLKEFGALNVPEASDE